MCGEGWGSGDALVRATVFMLLYAGTGPGPLNTLAHQDHTQGPLVVTPSHVRGGETGPQRDQSCLGRTAYEWLGWWKERTGRGPLPPGLAEGQRSLGPEGAAPAPRPRLAWGE